MQQQPAESLHITPVLKSVHWLPVQYRITFNILLIVYEALNGLAPQHISDLLTDHDPSGLSDHQAEAF